MRPSSKFGSFSYEGDAEPQMLQKAKLKDDRMLSPRTLRVRRDEVGMGFVRPLVAERVLPDGSDTSSRFSLWPRTSTTHQGPVRQGFQGTRPAPSERAWVRSTRLGPLASSPPHNDVEGLIPVGSDRSREFLELLELPASPVRHRLELQGSPKNVLLERETKTPGSLQIPWGIAVRPWGVVNDVFGNDQPLGPGVQVADLANNRSQDFLHLLVHPLVGSHLAEPQRSAEPPLGAQHGSQLLHEGVLKLGPRSERTSAGSVLLLKTQRVKARCTSL